MMKEMYRQAAKDLTKSSVDLIRQVLEKHDAAILEEIHEQLKERDLEIARLNDIIVHCEKGL